MLRLSAIVPATNRPPTLARCLHAIRASEDPPDEIVVVRDPLGAGPALARNLGAKRAQGEVLVFVDADVEVHPDAFRRIRSAFEQRPGLVALFGAYDDAPAESGLVSTFRNLLHHHVHLTSAGPAETFWAGLGAVRREQFLRAGGFDGERFRAPSVEDIELGMRLVSAGALIELDPEVQGKHLKRWTLSGMVRADLVGRGIPWVVLLLRTRSPSTALNLGWRHRASAAVSLLAAGALGARRTRIATTSLLALVALNRSFYALLARRCGLLAAGAGVGLHVVHHLTAAAALPAGVVSYFLEEIRAGRLSARARARSRRARRSPPPPHRSARC